MDKNKIRLARMHHGAGYTLHEEVKHPTPALLRASQIGVLTHDEPSMAKREDKDALLVVSYGAARQESRRAAIEPILDAVAAENPEADLYEAYTSLVMRKRIQETGLEMPSVEEALDTLLANGMKLDKLTDEDKWMKAARGTWPKFYDQVGGKAILDEAVAAMKAQ